MNKQQALEECKVVPYTDRDSCNGHKNYVTWQLWLQVDSIFYFWKEQAKMVSKPEELMYLLQEYYEEAIDELENDEILTDWRLTLLRNAFEKVDWWGLVCMLVNRVYEDDEE